MAEDLFDAFSEKAKEEVAEMRKRDEEWKARIESEGIKTAKDKLTLRDLEVEKISWKVFVKNRDILDEQEKDFLYWVSSEQQLLDIGIDKDFLAWAEYNNFIGWWKNKQKFFINMGAIITLCNNSELITN